MPRIYPWSPSTIADFLDAGMYFSVTCHACSRYSEKQDMLALALHYGRQTDLYERIFRKLVCQGCKKKLAITIGQEMILRGSIPKRHDNP